MGETSTPDEVRAKIVAAMPAPLGQVYYELSNQVVWVHLKWKDFRELYAKAPETIDLLNAAAPAFFYNLQQMMWDDVLLHLCRITDPTKSAGKDTLTIRRLPDEIPDTALRSQLEALAEDARKKTEFARHWRNRRLAHCELPPLAGQSPRPLPAASREHVEVALAAISEAMNAIERHYLHSAVSYKDTIEALGGVDSLIGLLRKGVNAERAEREKLQGK